MRKSVAGGALIAASLVLALHSPQSLTGYNHDSPVTSQPGAAPANMELKSTSIPSNQVSVTLVQTIDGDTIKGKVNGKVESIRYLLVDTPESKKPGMCVQPYAKEAFLRNNQLVRSGRLTIELEQGNVRDTYGRLLAYVYVNGKSVQEMLLKEGFARVAYVMNPPYKFLTAYRADEILAKRNKINIWSRPNYVTDRGFNGCVQGGNSESKN